MNALLLATLAIALEAATLYALLSVTPRWTQTAPDYSRSIAAGLSNLENALYRYAKANGGALPAQTGATDGGLSNLKSGNYLAFLPQAPSGYAWKYGVNGIPQPYVCLYQKSGAASAPQDVYQGMKRLRRLLPYTRFVLHTGGSAACGTQAGSSVDPDTSPPGPADPSSYPANVSITYFLKYIAGQSPASTVLPCSGNECLGSPLL